MFHSLMNDSAPLQVGPTLSFGLMTHACRVAASCSSKQTRSANGQHRSASETDQSFGDRAKRNLTPARHSVSQDRVVTLPIGYFGASTGAAAALVAAADLGDQVAAVVSRGGRPDLAGAWLPEVNASTLLIVGGRDEQVIELNLEAYRQLRCEKNLVIVDRATHLFEEPGALEEVARLAAQWFKTYFESRD
jgi:putative phosphoribosyl transferase